MQSDSKERFIEVVRKMDTLAEVITFANNECERVEASNRGLHSRAARDRSFGPSYRDFLGRFLYYVQSGHVAASSSPDELDVFASVVAGLNRKKENNPNVPNENETK